MALDHIIVRGAREHNLKNINVKFPRDRLVVVTGLSGSGKSSLAFDTIYAEGQRRYVESLSAYARQFLGLMEKPDVDYIDGLSPAISIEQRSTSRNPRSTVGTVTEIYDYLRLLYARVGTPYCHNCGREISRQTVQQMVDRVLQFPAGTALQILAPLIRGRKGEYKGLFDRVQKDGYVRVRIDGELYPVENAPELAKNRKHTIEVVVDRLKVAPKVVARLSDSLETALALGSGIVVVDVQGSGDVVFSEHFACVHCGISIEEIAPRMFSFNNPYGACPTCSGLGTTMDLDPDRIVPDPSKSLDDGAIATWGSLHNSWYSYWLSGLAGHYGFSLTHPFGKLPENIRRVIFHGSGDEEIEFNYQHSKARGSGVVVSKFEGVIPNLARRYRQTTSTHIRAWIEGFMSVKPCPECQGARLKPQSLAVSLGGLNIYELTRLSIREAGKFFAKLSLTGRQSAIARQILKEIRDRLGFLANVGLDYLTLDRNAGTLSGGEAERIRLATQIGSSLMGVLYILDEPSIGLHQRDNDRLLDTLCHLRDMGNTVLVVEHDRATIERADYVIDLGPGAGVHGGRVVVQGPPEQIRKNRNSLTGAYLTGRRRIPVPQIRRRAGERSLVVRGARENNLKSIDVEFPLGLFICVTGVSGSGKSTLVNEILYKWLARYFYNSKDTPGACDDIEGVYYVDKVICIDQNPIGRTPRSNPATYTGLFTHIRDIFAQVPDAKMRGYQPGRFSFNVKGGRCEACRGDGIIKIEMHFLPDVYVPCEVCKGKRYNRETLEITYKRRNIAQVLDMTVEEGMEFFENIPTASRKLETLFKVGLGYITLGQPATTLSGGEAQRVKLAAELSKVSTGRTLYILDEPTTGLHFEDIRMLLDVLNQLVDVGNTVVVIEHNLDVIKTADYIVDLGPEGGDEGGWVVEAGPPEVIAASERSYTGKFIRSELAQALKTTGKGTHARQRTRA